MLLYHPLPRHTEKLSWVTAFFCVLLSTLHLCHARNVSVLLFFRAKIFFLPVAFRLILVNLPQFTDRRLAPLDAPAFTLTRTHAHTHTHTHTHTHSAVRPTIHYYGTTDLLHTHTVQGSAASKYSLSLSRPLFLFVPLSLSLDTKGRYSVLFCFVFVFVFFMTMLRLQSCNQLDC